MRKDELRAAMGQTMCDTLDALRERFNAKLVYVEFADGRSAGERPDWYEIELESTARKAKSGSVMSDEQYAEYLKLLDREWKKFERVRARLRA